MAFQNIEINSFRGIKQLKLEKLSRINVLLGSNNCGKTSVLEACFLLVGISNPLLNRNLNYLRDLTTGKGNELLTLFHNMDKNEIIQLSADETANQHRTMSICPSFSEVVPTGVDGNASSQPQQEISGLQTNFQITKDRNSDSYETSMLLKNTNDKISVETKINQKYNETLYAKFISSKFSFQIVIDTLKQLIKDKKIEDIIGVLKHVEPNLCDIQVVDNEVIVDTGLASYIPVNVMGDGFRKVLALVTSLYECKNGMLFVDEIDNGLHYSALKTVWKALFKSAKEYNVQLFVTTHNLELLTSLNALLEDNSYLENRNDIMCYTIRKYPNDEMIAYAYDYENMKIAIEQEIDMR